MTSPGSKELIFCVEDEPDNLDFLRRVLAPEYEVHAFTDPREALKAAVDAQPVCLVVDYKMPHLSGVELVQAFRQKGLRCAVVMVTAFPELDEVVYSQQVALVYQIIPKPVEPEHLRSQVQLALARTFYRDALTSYMRRERQLK